MAAANELPIEGAIEIEVDVDPDVTPPRSTTEAVDNLRGDLDARRAAEDVTRQAGVDAERRANEERTARVRAQRETDDANLRADTAVRGERQAQLDAVSSSLRAEEDKGAQLAQRLAAAQEAGDFKKSSELSLEISVVGGNIAALKNGKGALEEQIKTAPPPPKPGERTPTPSDIEETWLGQQHPVNAAWVRANRARFFSDQAFRNKATAASQYLTNVKGMTCDDPAYVQALETELGMRKAAPDTATEPSTESRRTEQTRQGAEPPPPRQQTRTAAPPSRQAPTGGTRTSPMKVTLTPDEVAIAKQTFTPDIIGKNPDGTPRDPLKAFAARKLELENEGRRF